MWSDCYEKQGDHYITGKYDFNGNNAPLSNKMIQFPIKNGTNRQKGHSKLFPRLGYGIEFSIKTIGDYFYSNQIVELEPSYYILDPTTKERVEVSLYVKGKQGYERYEKVERNNIILTNRLNSKQSAANKDLIRRTLDIYRRKSLPLGDKNNIAVIPEYYERDVQTPMETGFPNHTLLRIGNRVFRGDKMSAKVGTVDPDLIQASAQQWYGRFYIPNTAVALRKDDDIRIAYKEGRKPFIKDGILIVNMKVRVYRSEEKMKIPRLEYVNSSQNSWIKEGFLERIDTGESMEFPLEPGDIAVFNLSKRASDSYGFGRQ